MRRPSSVWRRIRSRIACRYACARVSSTPSRASRRAGSNSLRHGSLPWPRWAASSPAAAPGTAQDAVPIRKTCVSSRSKSMSIASISAGRRRSRPSPGAATKKSNSRSVRSRARWTSMKPPAPGPVSGLSATQEANAAATHASTALPPSARMLAPASAVSGCPAAIAPRMPSSVSFRTKSGTGCAGAMTTSFGLNPDFQPWRRRARACRARRSHP